MPPLGCPTFPKTISRGGAMVNPNGITAAINIIVWRAPFARTVAAVKGYRVGGTGGDGEGGGRTPEILNGCELCIRFDKPPTQPQCLKYWASGTYLLAGGSFIPLLSLAAAVIGPGLQLVHMPALARVIFEGRRMPVGAQVLIRSNDYEAALASWRAYRHPRLMFLGQAAYGL
jgi:hypothetical protein